MSGPPSVATQRKIMRTLVGRKIQSSDAWEYAVARSWLVAWQETDSQSKTSCEPEDTFSLISISKDWVHTSIENASKSLGTHSSCITPVYMSETDYENTYVPETQWKLYISWFGLDSKHQLRRRPTFSQYLSLEPVWTPGAADVLSDRELDFLPVWVCSLEELVNGGKHRLINVYAWDDLGYIETQVRRVLDIDTNKKIRFWFNVKENDEDIVLEPIQNFKQSLLSRVTEIVPDVREVMQTRQCQMSAQHSQVGSTNTNVRQRLSEVWFGNRILGISLAAEVVGVSVAGMKIAQSSEASIEDGMDSIVTLSSIRNEWDDILATHFETYVEQMGKTTQEIKDILLNSAKTIVGEKIDEINDIKTDYEIRFAALRKQEEVIKCREIVVLEQEKDLNERLSRFKTGLIDFQQKQHQLAEELRRIESQNKIAASKIVLNVGGNLFTTSLTTLTSGEEGSLLVMMFSGRHNIQQEVDGSYFIDRDGLNFRHILNYMRDGERSVDAISDQQKLVKELLAEADFYKLPKFRHLLMEKVGFTSVPRPASPVQSTEHQSYMTV